MVDSGVWPRFEASLFLRSFDQVSAVLSAMSGNLRKGAHGKIKEGCARFAFIVFYPPSSDGA